MSQILMDDKWYVYGAIIFSLALGTALCITWLIDRP